MVPVKSAAPTCCRVGFTPVWSLPRQAADPLRSRLNPLTNKVYANCPKKQNGPALLHNTQCSPGWAVMHQEVSPRGDPDETANLPVQLQWSQDKPGGHKGSFFLAPKP